MTYIEEIQKLTEENKDYILIQYKLQIKAKISNAAKIGNRSIFFQQLDIDNENKIYSIKEHFKSENFKVELEKVALQDKLQLKISW